MRPPLRRQQQQQQQRVMIGARDDHMHHRSLNSFVGSDTVRTSAIGTSQQHRFLSVHTNDNDDNNNAMQNHNNSTEEEEHTEENEVVPSRKSNGIQTKSTRNVSRNEEDNEDEDEDDWEDIDINVDDSDNENEDDKSTTNNNNMTTKRENENDKDDSEPDLMDPTTPTMKLFPVYTRYDLEEILNHSERNRLSTRYQEDTSVAITSLFDVKHLKRQMKQALGTSIRDLYYHNGTDWLPLQTQEHIETVRTMLQQQQRPDVPNYLIPIKLGKFYDEFTNDVPSSNSNEDFDNIDHPSNVMHDDGTQNIEPIEDNDDPTSEFLKYIPKNESAHNGTGPNSSSNNMNRMSKQDQTLIQLASVVEQVIKKLHAPDCPYERLHAYTTTVSPQRVVLKWKKKQRDMEHNVSMLNRHIHSPNNDDNVVDTNPITTNTTTTTTTKELPQQHDVITGKAATAETMKRETDGIGTAANANSMTPAVSDESKLDGKMDVSSRTSSSSTEQEEGETETEAADAKIDNYQEDDGLSIDTRVYIMQLASSIKGEDQILAQNLRNCIMAYPNALDHIANCIHMFNFDGSAASSPSSSDTTSSTETFNNSTTTTTTNDSDTKQSITM
jgi:hypothetical protein